MMMLRGYVNVWGGGGGGQGVRYVCVRSSQNCYNIVCYPVAGLEICGILVANTTMSSHLLPLDYHVVANICYCHKFMVLLI